jgi:DNA-directed RNA polymerase specialized sigma24 family protein
MEPISLWMYLWTHLKKNKKRKDRESKKMKQAIEEAIWIERTVNNLTYKEIADKLDVTIYRVKKVIYERSKAGTRGYKRKD